MMAEKVEIYKECLKSNNFNKILNIYFSEWENKNCHRYFSWEYCYKFFFENQCKNFNTDIELLDKACLNLGFYLASWGMYRGSSNLLQKDYTVHKDLIICLLKNCKKLFDNSEDWNDTIENAINIIKNCYHAQKVTPTETLVTKVLMGIFGCVPAYDRFFIDGLKEYNKYNSISQNFNKQSFNSLRQLEEKITIRKNLKNSKIPYPKMKLIDSCFWVIGYELEQKKKKHNSKE